MTFRAVGLVWSLTLGADVMPNSGGFEEIDREFAEYLARPRKTADRPALFRHLRAPDRMGEVEMVTDSLGRRKTQLLSLEVLPVRRVPVSVAA